jgi:opacity protein-like surface antigen
MTYSFSKSARARRTAVLFTVVLATSMIFATGAVAGSFGVDVAYISPEGLDGTIGVGGFLNFATPVSSLQVEPFASYWSKSEGVPGAEASLSDLTLGARGKFMIPLDAKVEPYLAGGLGIHVLKASSDITLFDQSTSFSVSDSKLGVDLGGGISVPITERFSLRGEGWYSFVDSSNWASARIGAMFSM